MSNCDLMIFAPHPDDAEIAMGGTIASLIRQGSSVVLVDMTDGEPTPHGSKEIRERETAAATEALGLHQRIQLDLVNREIFDTLENRKKVAEVMREYKPKIIFAPYWEDAHPDHTKACTLIEAARFYSKFVKTDMSHEAHYPARLLHFFSTHIRVSFRPSFVFDISDTMEAKMDSLRAYASQFVQNEKNIHVLDSIVAESSYWGRQIGVKYGEPFICREVLKLRSSEGLLESCL